ncbi:MAG TPA: aspartate/glutamate racemase family protein [Thermoanaerobaculia bacterium]|nr:aspartate/glutamate racemase family protein [Thermoanaerobaculia bacterium]
MSPRARPGRPLLGVVGGLGPLASAELLATLYRLDPPEREQEAPRCLLLSDPTFPDRTEAILRGETGELARRLGEAVASLLEQGAAPVVVACVTIHRVLPELPESLRRRVVSLVDLIVEELLADPRERLLLATTGSRRGGVFTAHPRWSAVAGVLRDLEPSDQEALHDRLYRLKRGEPPEAAIPFVEELESRYGVRGLVFGCTELHLLQRPLAARGEATGGRVVDPLMTVARRFHEIVEGRYP